MKTAFWIALATVFYTFAGYGILLYALVRLRRIVAGHRQPPEPADAALPTLTIVVAAYNEAGIIAEKIANTLALRYPEEKLRILFVSDGSTDGTEQIIARHPQVVLMHSAKRNGKMAAIHRAMVSVNSEIVVFTDANTFLNENALRLIARHYTNAAVGAVSGEKRVVSATVSDATAGEGFYWKYESALKRWDSELYSVVGAAGELFSIRTALYEPVPADAVLDDFIISMRIAAQGYRIVYEPDACATEGTSANVGEEWKRKVRIAAGGIQSILRLPRLLNPLRMPLLTFQYISHRVLRWTVTPFLLILAFILNAAIVLRGGGAVYQALFAAQCGFYALALAGYALSLRKIKVKVAFIPYYFCMMNAAVIAGIGRYFFRKSGQTVLWEKAARREAPVLAQDI